MEQPRGAFVAAWERDKIFPLLWSRTRERETIKVGGRGLLVAAKEKGMERRRVGEGRATKERRERPDPKRERGGGGGGGGGGEKTCDQDINSSQE